MSDGIIELTKALNDYGPALVVMAALLLLNGFFIWRDSRRENFLQEQLAEVHKMYIPLLTKCEEAIGASTEVIRQNNQLYTLTIQALGNRDA